MCLNSQCWYPLKVHCGLKAHPSAELAFKLDKQKIQVFEVLLFWRLIDSSHSLSPISLVLKVALRWLATQIAFTNLGSEHAPQYRLSWCLSERYSHHVLSGQFPAPNNLPSGPQNTILSGVSWLSKSGEEYSPYLFRKINPYNPGPIQSILRLN